MKRTPLVRKGSAVIIICLMLLMSVPLVSSNEMPVMNNNLSSVICKRTTFSYGEDNSQSISDRLVDNFNIRCYGKFDLFNLLGIILGAPVPYISLEIIHFNNISVTIEDHFTLIDTKHDRILYDFDAGGLPWKLQPNCYFDTGMFTNIQWKGANYIFGPFDLIYTLHIPEDNSSTTVLFHGFVFVIGAKIFNSAGEVIKPVQAGVR